MVHPPYTIILQSESVASGNHSCHGLGANAVLQPVRLRVVSDPDSDAARGRLVDALIAALEPFAAEGFEKCGGPGQLDCWATQEPNARNLLLVVGGDSAPSAALESLVDGWKQRGFEAIGVFRNGLNPDDVLPSGLARQHAPSWLSDVREVVPDLVDVVALGAEDRRIFISYSHHDGKVLAERIALLLTARRFDVFLDRFRLTAGVDFAERIEDELLDKAMVVVIETPESVQSDWVKHEVAIAAARRLGLVAIQDGPDRLAAIDPRTRRPATDTDEALGDFLVTEHRAQLRQKRENLLVSVWRSLTRAGVAPRDITVQPIGFAVTTKPGYVLAVHPRPADLHRFRLAQESVGAAAKPVVVHPSPTRADRRQDLIWLGLAADVVEVDEGSMDFAATDIAGGVL